LTVLVVGLSVVCLGGLVYLGTFPPMATVLTGSMEPGIDTGDVVIMKSLRGRSPRVGQIVLVNVPDRFQQRFSYPDRVIHRVERIEDGWVTTKGDNLGEPDPFRVRASAIDQRVFIVVPGGGRVLDFFRSPFGLVWVGLGVLLFVVLPALDSQREQVKLQRSTMATVRRVSDEVKALKASDQGPPRERVAVEPDLAVVHEVVAELVDAMADYGEHLRRNTELVQSVAVASHDLAAEVTRLRQEVARLSASASPVQETGHEARTLTQFDVLSVDLVDDVVGSGASPGQAEEAAAVRTAVAMTSPDHRF
jgi:signal peptidase I